MNAKDHERLLLGWAHDLPHPFIPRMKGSPEACRVCGGRAWDPIHVTKERRVGDVTGGA